MTTLNERTTRSRPRSWSHSRWLLIGGLLAAIAVAVVLILVYTTGGGGGGGGPY